MALGLFAANVLLFVRNSTRRVGVILFLPYLYVVAAHLLMVMGARLFVPAVFAQWIAFAILLEQRKHPGEVRLAIR